MTTCTYHLHHTLFLAVCRRFISRTRGRSYRCYRRYVLYAILLRRGLFILTMLGGAGKCLRCGRQDMLLFAFVLLP